MLPVVLDVGTNNEELLNDPLYLGMPHRRLDGEEYYSFVDEWVTAVKARWPSTFVVSLLHDDDPLLTLSFYFIDALIQFEDFKYPHAYNLLNKCKCLLLL